uniref:Uncharacterized protein n=1 Tax=Anopheles darlingi TaxID=43151 RepID=A0A2M4D2K8_ANODA
MFFRYFCAFSANSFTVFATQLLQYMLRFRFRPNFSMGCSWWTLGGFIDFGTISILTTPTLLTIASSTRSGQIPPGNGIPAS